YSIFPQLGSGVGTPAPKKLRAASVIIDSAKINVAWTIKGDKALGAICKNIILKAEAPCALIASMYVSSLIAIALDLTILAINGVKTILRAIITFDVLG